MTYTATIRHHSIARARMIDEEYQPAFGVQVEDSDGRAVWDSEAA